jgi:hypothetical protein
MKRLYGHLGWYDEESGEFENGRALCGKRSTRRRTAPVLTCGKCTAVLIDMLEPQPVVTARVFRLPDPNGAA